jgi:hypothetical protein
MLPLWPVQTERSIRRRRILKAELSSSLKKWNLRRERLLFHCCYHRPLGLRLLQAREKEREFFVMTVTFVLTFSFESLSSLLVT